MPGSAMTTVLCKENKKSGKGFQYTFIISGKTCLNIRKEI